MSAETRFWAKVQRGTDDECWLWTGGTAHGYGRFRPDPRRSSRRPAVAAHRFAYELLIGPIPEGLTLDHLCEVRNCVNPAHLRPATNGDNARRSENTWAGRNVRKTHCKRGHPYDDENTAWVKSVRGRLARECRICRLARRHAYLARSRDPQAQPSADRKEPQT
jgi:hypothetical protein